MCKHASMLIVIENRRNKLQAELTDLDAAARFHHQMLEKLANKKNNAAATLGRLGGKKGGKARAAALTPERRAEIARLAANKRWHPESSKR